MTSVDTRRVYRLGERVMLDPDGDATLAFDPDALAVHQLNDTLSSVARLLDGTRSTEAVVLACAERWGVAIDAAAEHVYRALQLLQNEGLIEACG